MHSWVSCFAKYISNILLLSYISAEYHEFHVERLCHDETKSVNILRYTVKTQSFLAVCPLL